MLNEKYLPLVLNQLLSSVAAKATHQNYFYIENVSIPNTF